MRTNKHRGASFDDWLAEEGILEEVTERALKRLLVMEIEGTVNPAKCQKTTRTAKSRTEPVQVNPHLFELDNTALTSELLNRLVYATD